MSHHRGCFECRRYERLLATALRIASADGRDCDPLELLEVIATITGDDLSRAPTPRRPLSVDQLVRLLRAPDPSPLASAAA